VSCEHLALGVDRLDYTKGIVERLMAIEYLLEEHPWHRERLTIVQIAAPSRTRIPSYIDLRRQVKETADRINQRYQTAKWKPVILIERQCNHEQVDRWYRAADLVPGDLAARWNEPCSQGVYCRARRRGRGSGAEQVYRGCC